MRRLFNATCTRCGEFKPRCARVNLVNPNVQPPLVYRVVTFCADCRKDCRGEFKLAEEHR